MRKSRQRKKQNMTSILIFIVIVVVLAVAGIAAIYFIAPLSSDFVEITSITIANDSLILSNNCTGLIASTTPERLESIRLGLENRVDVRPTTHDNFVALLNAFNITLDRVEIYRFNEGIFYSDAYFHSSTSVLQMDMRPSDAIALAVRTKSPVYINKTLLASMGKDIC